LLSKARKEADKIRIKAQEEANKILEKAESK
jgi:F0F1-type ATP synthase membrane subunit b/b'